MKNLILLSLLLLPSLAKAQCTADILQTGPILVCQGATSTLTSTTGGTAYQWYENGVPISGATSDTYDPPTVNIGSFTYTVEITFNTCTDMSDPVTVNVQPTPTVTITSNSPVCPGETLTLLAVPSMMGVTYSWVGPNNFTANTANVAVPNMQQANTGLYYVTVNSTSCTSGPASVNASLHPVLNISATYTDPSSLTAYDGSITIGGLVSGMNVTVGYSKNGIPNILTMPVLGGSTTINNLGTGVYDNIYVVPNTGCQSNLLGPYVLQDWVWPGDVNYDLIADNTDVLDLALAYGQAGNVRTSATNGWYAQECTDWGTLQGNGVDMKHADCDGNGTVDIDDTMAISLNYGQTHLKEGPHIPQAKSTAFPDLYFDMTGITLQAGTTVDIPIKLGTTTMPMNDIMGIAANIKLQGIELDNAPSVSIPVSWLGNNTNTINFAKGISGTQTDWAFVRTDHTNASGDGTFATLTMEIPLNAPAQNATLYFDNVIIIDNTGAELTDYNVLDATTPVIPVDLKDAVAVGNSISISPNPATNMLLVTQEQLSFTQAIIYNQLGQQVSAQRLNGKVTKLDISELPAGVYQINLEGNKSKEVKRLVKM